jgi:hypothetical protein
MFEYSRIFVSLDKETKEVLGFIYLARFENSWIIQTMVV